MCMYIICAWLVMCDIHDIIARDTIWYKNNLILYQYTRYTYTINVTWLFTWFTMWHLYCCKVWTIRWTMNDYSVSAIASASVNISCHTKGKSKVWKHFEFVVNEKRKIANDKKVIYQLCKYQLAYSENTTNLFCHLERNILVSLLLCEMKQVWLWLP